MTFAKARPDSSARLGCNESRNTLAVRDRLALTYRDAHHEFAPAMDAYAAFLTSLHDGLVGRMASVSRICGIDQNKLGEALRGDRTLSGLSMFKLLDAVPAVVFRALDVVAARYGFTVARSASAPRLTEAETVARMMEQASALAACYTRAHADGQITPAERAELRRHLVGLIDTCDEERHHLEEGAA